MQMTIATITEKVVPILKNAGITRSSLFGSYVRGEQKEESDIDILIDFPRGKGLFSFVRLQSVLQNALEKKVDLVEYASLHPLLKERILKEQIRII